MRPPEEMKRELVRQWLAKADEDMGLAEHLLGEGSPYLNAICFHSQQAAEKYLKAYLVNLQLEFPKTHDIDKLLDILGTVDAVLSESLRDAEALSDYGVEVRYPGDLPDLSNDEAREAVRLAGVVRDAVMAQLAS